MLWRGEALDRVLARAFRKLDTPADRGLARAIAGGVLRHLTDLDHLIDSATARPLPDDSRARMVLRMALFQALAMGTPPHAVISTALPLLEGGPRRLVHGVLSTLFKGGAALPQTPTLPDLWTMRWGEAWGDAMVLAASVALASEPPLDLTLRNPDETAHWAERLGGSSLMVGHVRIDAKGRIEDLPGYAEGGWWVQDLAASIAARLLGNVAGKTVVDLCAAPGGKTMQLAAAGARVTAIDASLQRLERVTENLMRTGLSADVIAADAAVWKPTSPPDVVLLDAPCSGTGIFRRHPDALYLKSARQIAELAGQQRTLLDNAADMLKPGGTLVYCVCSLEPEEGEAQIAALLDRRSDVSIDPVRADELPEGITPDAAGRVRILPGGLAAVGGLDGFFIARVVKA